METMIRWERCYGRHKRRRLNSLPELPDSAILEILSRLPIESVLRFKCVSKKWCSWIDDPWFKEKHMSQMPPLVLSNQYKKGNEILLVAADGDFVLCGRIKGLCLEKSSTSLACRIRNPITRRVVNLPNRHEGKCEHLSFVPKSFRNDECKVFCIYRNKKQGVGDHLNSDYYVLSVEILTVGKDEQWRTFEMPDRYVIEGKRGMKKYFSAIDFAGGVVYLTQLMRNQWDVQTLEVQSLDLDNECVISTATLPGGVFWDLKGVSVFLWKQLLAVGYVSITHNSLLVMLLEDYKRQKWRRKKFPLTFLKEDPSLGKGILLIKARSGDDKFEFHREGQVIMYNVKNKITRVVKIKNYGMVYRGGYHIPSLMSLKGMEPEKDATTKKEE